MKLKFTSLIFIIFFCKHSYGQFEINPAHLPTKINCLYILTEDSTSEYSIALLKLLQEAWTLSPVKYSSKTISDKSLINEGNIFASTVRQNNKSILRRAFLF